MSIWTHFTTETTCVAFDTETNGLFRQGKNNPRMVELAWSIFSIDRGDIKKQSHLIRADDFDPNPSGNLKHGIDRARSLREGIPPLEALERFRQDVIANGVKILVGHNIEFDIMVLKSECLVVRHNLSDVLGLPQFCTMKEMTGVLQIQNDRNKHRYEARVSAYEESLDLRTRGAKRSLARFEAYLSKELLTNKFKYPSLSELYLHLFKVPLVNWHDAAADVEACKQCFVKIAARKLVENHERVQNAKINAGLIEVERQRRERLRVIEEQKIQAGEKQKRLERENRKKELKKRIALVIWVIFLYLLIYLGFRH